MICRAKQSSDGLGSNLSREAYITEGNMDEAVTQLNAGSQTSKTPV